MKATLLFNILVLFGISTQAQVINGGFENWDNSSQICNDPISWESFNSATADFGVCTVVQETNDVHSGTSAMRISVETLILAPDPDEIIPGIATNGTVDLFNELLEGGQSYTARPTSFTGWFKAEPVNQDWYYFQALLINEISGDTIGAAEWGDTAIVSSYTQFDAPVFYWSPESPTLLQISLYGGDLDDPQEGTVVWFDDIEDVVDASGISEVELASINSYPNPVVDNLKFNLGNQKSVDVQLFNILGDKMLQTEISQSKNSIDMSTLSNGVYIWQMTSDENQLIKTGKFVLAR